MSTQQENSSAAAYDELFEQVVNGQGLLRLKCKQCKIIFDHHKPSLFKAHLETAHATGGKVNFAALREYLRHVCLDQIKHKIAGPTCTSCQVALPASTATSLCQHLRTCQQHYIEAKDAEVHLNMLLSSTPIATGETYGEALTNSQLSDTMTTAESNSLFVEQTCLSFFCPLGGCTFATRHFALDPEEGKKNLYKHMRNTHGKGSLNYGALKDLAFSTEPRLAVAQGKRGFIPLDGRTDLDPPHPALSDRQSCVSDLSREFEAAIERELLKENAQSGLGGEFDIEGGLDIWGGFEDDFGGDVVGGGDFVGDVVGGGEFGEDVVGGDDFGEDVAVGGGKGCIDVRGKKSNTRKKGVTEPEFDDSDEEDDQRRRKQVAKRPKPALYRDAIRLYNL